MQDRPRGDQFTPKPEVALSPEIVDVLRGTISELVKTVSNRPGQIGQEVEVRLAVEGPGMFGLTDWKDNREWAGIFNHIVLSARYADHFAKGLESKGVAVDRQTLMDAMIVSHPGRRQWDEAGWYGQAVAERVGAATHWIRANLSNEALGLRLIRDKVPEKVFTLVTALAHGTQGIEIDPAVYDSMEYKLAIYTDHRTSQKYEPLNIRMGDFLINNFFYLGVLESEEKKNEVYGTLESIIQGQVRNRLKGIGSLSLRDVDQMIAGLGAYPGSYRLPRVELMRLVLQDADTEAMLIRSRVDADNVDDETVPMPKWEDELRCKYVEAAKDGIFSRWHEIHYMGPKYRVDHGVQVDKVAVVESDFPSGTWWGRYARKLLQSSL